MIECGYKLDEVLNMGYHEVYRLWTIIDEIRFRKLQQIAVINDLPYYGEEKRKEIWDWLKINQPRTHREKSIPQEVLDRFSDMFNGEVKRG